MKCYHCGTSDTRVLSTRMRNGVKTRRHECGNGHRFNTIEYYEVLLHHLRKPLPAIEAVVGRGIEARRVEHLRGAQMARAVAAGESKASVARRYGVPWSTVARQVKKHTRQSALGNAAGASTT